ncbi:TonB-dependent receptor [Pedobacter sp. MC2016-14]|uniref:TonB-dependent receptor n=1 Tax=Pedobacter sp. MC2016-14 TaxID=2897327 RepID=UPI001E3D7825|nr:TonB-dependent receptor [Pedobacter sp. MC2016-14]MCD0487472.1 TonB-dependent receptor [Pedobacter sp. MC2016-14]
MMKITFILLTALVVHVHASSMAQTVSIKAENLPLKEFVIRLQKATGYNFICNSELLNAAKPITIAVKNASMESVFKQCFTNNGLAYTINEGERTVVLSKLPAVKRDRIADPVKGNVVDEKGLGLPGVTVTVKGTKTVVITNNSGFFSINVPNNQAALVFSLVGYDSQEVKVNGQPLKVTLIESNKRLSEVLVIGYGTQKRSDLTAPISSLNAKSIEERGLTRVDQALVGQLAGVNVKQTTGLPGKGFSIQVRGSGSITANTEPLYVLDGFPLGQSMADVSGGFSGGNALDNINPDDIESIEVLKDAAAAAIYGSRGSNGVVMITTKRGQVGRAKIQFSSSFGLSDVNRKLDMLNAEEWIDRATEMINTAYVNTYKSKGALASDDEAKRIANIGGRNVNYMLDRRWALPGHPGLQFIDWQDEIFRTGLGRNHQVSASGGTNNVNYFVSVNNIDQEGVVLATRSNLFSARTNVEVNLNQKLKVGVNLSPSYSISQDPGVEGKDVIFHQALSMPPVQEDTVGLNANAFKNAAYNYAQTLTSPVAKALNQVGQTKRYRTIASVYGIYNILKNFTFKTSVNIDNSQSDINRYTPYTVAGLLSVRNSQTTLNTTGSNLTLNYQSFVNENTLNYSTVIHKDHNLNFLLGQSYNNFYSDNTTVSSVGGYTSSTIQTLNYAAGVRLQTGVSKSILLSYFTRAQYSFKGKYLLSASIRTDGSSKFGRNNKYGVFPAVSAGWRLSDEQFIKKLNIVSDLKLRASLGVTGNNTIGDFGSISTTGIYNYVFGSTQALAGGQAPNRVANPDLRWEKSATKGIGLDFGFFKNRLTGSFDYYNRLTTDLLLNVPTLAATGFQTYLGNAGSVRNKGYELELSTRNLTGKFKWTTNFQGSFTANKVVALADGQSQILLPSVYTDIPNTILKVGEPLNSIFIVKQIGMLTQEDMNNKVAVYGTQTVGDPKYEDFDGNGVINANDRQIMGHPNPDFTWGITNTFSFKGFDLKVLVQGQNGGSIYSLLGRAISKTGIGYGFNMSGDYRNRWRSPEDPGDGVRSKAFSNFGHIVNSDWLYSSDYFRVRSITLGYNLKQLVNLKNISTARLFFSAENYFGRDKYYGGANPESANTDVSGNGNYPQSGDYGGLPLPKTLTFGLNVSF